MNPEFTPGPSPLAGYQHDHPEVINPIETYRDQAPLGVRVADAVSRVVGSWPFIIIQTILLSFWIAANVYLVFHQAVLKAFDPYPFILLNLALSFQAAYTGPIVMMSQNRQSEKDRLMAQSDYECNTKAEVEIRLLMEQLKRHDLMLEELLRRTTRKGSSV